MTTKSDLRMAVQPIHLCLALVALGICLAAQGADTTLRIRMASGAELTVLGDANSACQIQYLDTFSTNNSWNVLTNVVLGGTATTVLDTTTPLPGRRFYRATTAGGSGGSTNPPFATPDRMYWVYPGSFLMGSPESDPDRSDFETPQSLVTLTYGFWIGQYEVSQQEYQAVTGKNPSSSTDNPSLPVDSVTWSEATNYCALLTEQERKAGRLTNNYAYRLPYEAEWEYAARGGKATRFSFGDDPGFTTVPLYAWTSENSGNDSHPVGQKSPNVWGLYDVYGNVAEWCLDWFGLYTEADKTNPTGPATGFDKVYRGGSWADAAADSRASARGGLNPNSRMSSFGFRVVLAPVRP